MKKFILRLTTLILLSQTNVVKASIVHVTLQPVIEVTCDVNGVQVGNWNLDLNNDSIVDFYFSSFYSTSINNPPTPLNDYIRFHSDSDNFVMTMNSNITNSAGCFYIDTLQNGSLITDTSNWKSTLGLGQTVGNSENTLGMGNNNYYFGVKFKIANVYHYGWIRVLYLTVPYTHLYIYDFAYETEINQPIIAGNTVSGITENTLPPLHLFPNPTKEIINLNGIAVQNQNDAMLSVTDITGKLVFQTQLNSNVPIDVSQLHTGLYFIYIESSKGKQMAKFVKE